MLHQMRMAGNGPQAEEQMHRRITESSTQSNKVDVLMKMAITFVDMFQSLHIYLRQKFMSRGYF